MDTSSNTGFQEKPSQETNGTVPNGGSNTGFQERPTDTNGTTNGTGGNTGFQTNGTSNVNVNLGETSFQFPPE
jgi:hypothetical protein